MQQLKSIFLHKDFQLIFVLLLFTFIALVFPAKIAIILTSIVFIIFAFTKPFESLLYLIIYVSIRPFLVEINPGLKYIGDLITVVILVKLLISSKFDLKSLLKFKFFEW